MCMAPLPGPLWALWALWASPTTCPLTICPYYMPGTFVGPLTICLAPLSALLYAWYLCWRYMGDICPAIYAWHLCRGPGDICLAPLPGHLCRGPGDICLAPLPGRAWGDICLAPLPGHLCLGLGRYMPGTSACRAGPGAIYAWAPLPGHLCLAPLPGPRAIYAWHLCLGTSAWAPLPGQAPMPGHLCLGPGLKSFALERPIHQLGQ